MLRFPGAVDGSAWFRFLGKAAAAAPALQLAGPEKNWTASDLARQSKRDGFMSLTDMLSGSTVHRSTKALPAMPCEP